MLMKVKRLLSVVLLIMLTLGLIMTQAAMGWDATGSLKTGRVYHTATLLQNAKSNVLVTGGISSGSTPLGSCELYDPATGQWTPTGGLNIWRYGHTATLLNNGWVLIAGGITTYGTPTLKAELYKPENNGCTPTADMKVARSGHKATLLNDGRVLVAGGGNANSCEIFDPSSGTWTLTGSQHSNRDQFTATLLLNGKVLTAGGINWNVSPYYMKSCELFTPGATPATGTWANTGDLKIARGYEFPATRLLDGRVLVAGGFDGTGAGGIYWPTATEIFEPAGDGGAGAWSLTGSIKKARVQHTATTLKNGWVLIAGGQGSGVYLTSTELFNPSLGVWADAAPLTTARTFHTATLLKNGKVLVVGGEPGNGVGLQSCELYLVPGSVAWPIGALNILLDETVIQ
jgi:large repetitive protein